MKIEIRVLVNTIIIWLTQEFYYSCIYTRLEQYDYALLIIFILPTIFTLLLTMIVNYVLNRIDKLSMSFNSNLVAALIGTTIITFIWFLKCKSISRLIDIGIEVPKFITSTIVLFSILLIWFIKFCVTSFLLKNNIEKKIKP